MINWRYYNRAMMPTTAPHEKVDTRCVEDKTIWKENTNALLARWTTDFDCGHETNWWYIIKDEPFDISKLKAKRRYEITKGNKNFNVREFNPVDYVEDIYQIQVSAYSKYPEKYRPSVDRLKLERSIKTWNFYKVYGAFSVENDTLKGYALLNRESTYIYYAFQKVYPDCESKGINAALVNYVLCDHEDFLAAGGYISDGSRNINHETAFQDYLEKYFGFRKAYCKLHVEYSSKIAIFVKLLYPFRLLLEKFDNNKWIHLINGVLKMEYFIREEK